MRTKTIVGALVAAVMFTIPVVAQAAKCSDGSQAKEEEAEPVVVRQRTATTATLEDDECIERDIRFMPGVVSVFFQPAASAGPFYGAGVQIAPLQWSHNNDRFGPSQGSFYLQAALLKSTQSTGTMALFDAGATASFERNASRRWMIPYFGATVGGMTQSELGTSLYAYPMGGVHLYWHRNLMLDAEGGYHFPFKDIDQTRGPRAQLTARFSLW